MSCLPTWCLTLCLGLLLSGLLQQILELTAAFLPLTFLTFQLAACKGKAWRKRNWCGSGRGAPHRHCKLPNAGSGHTGHFIPAWDLDCSVSCRLGVGSGHKGEVRCQAVHLVYGILVRSST